MVETVRKWRRHELFMLALVFNRCGDRDRADDLLIIASLVQEDENGFVVDVPPELSEEYERILYGDDAQ